MNILHVNKNLSAAGGGITQMIRDFAPELTKNGAKVSCLTAENIEVLPSGVKENIYLPEVSDPKSSEDKWRATLEQVLISRNIELVHIHEVKNLQLVQYLTDKLPVVIHFHNYGWWCPGNDLFYASSDDICPLSTGWKCIPNAFTKGCNVRHPRHLISAINNGYKKKNIWNDNVRFIAPSDYVHRKATQAGLAFSKINVVPYAVDNNRFVQNNRKAKDSLEPGYILYAGSLSQSKGVEYLLDAYSYIINLGKKLVLIGDGSYRLKIENHIRRLGLESHVQMLGWKEGDELSRFFHNCSMLVVPSVWSETFGVIGLEAMAAAKPVVAFDVGGISQWLDDSVTGYLVERKNIREMSLKMSKLIQNPQLAEEMGNLGWSRYQQEFTTEIQAENLMMVYQRAIDQCIIKN